MKKDINKHIDRATCIEAESRPDCFGNIDIVFPMSKDGLRCSPANCLKCDIKTQCLKSAIKGPAWADLEQEKIDRAHKAGAISFFKRWSEKKRLSIVGDVK